jgi:hypothetical protein
MRTHIMMLIYVLLWRRTVYRQVNDMEPQFVEIQPFEYQLIKNRLPRIVTYFGYKISPALTQEVLNKIVEDLKAKKKISIIQNPNGMLIWKYEGKPLVALNKSKGKVYATQGNINHYGLEYCQKQAAYVLQILRKYNLAKFTQYIVKLDIYRLGRTPEERRLTYEALERLSKKRRRGRIVREKPSIKGVQIHAERIRQDKLDYVVHKEETINDKEE